MHVASASAHRPARGVGPSGQIKLRGGVDRLDAGLALVAFFAWNAMTPIASTTSGRIDELRMPVVGLLP